MDGFEYSLEIINVLLKESIAETNFFLETNILLLKELLKQTINDYKISRQKKETLSFKECTFGTFSVAKTNILLQRKDGCN